MAAKEAVAPTKEAAKEEDVLEEEPPDLWSCAVRGGVGAAVVGVTPCGAHPPGWPSYARCAGARRHPRGRVGVPDPEEPERRGVQRTGLCAVLLVHARARALRGAALHVGAWLAGALVTGTVSCDHINDSWQPRLLSCAVVWV